MSALEHFISNHSVLRRAKQQAVDLIERFHTPEYTYHNLEHTFNVTACAFVLGEKEKLASQDLIKLIIAGLFHDTGYFESSSEHEQISAEHARKFLNDENLHPEEIQQICELILATKVTTEPKTILQKVLCDADLSYLGNDAFFSLVERLRLEWQLTGRKNFTEIDWIRQNIDFFEKHQFYTPSAQHHFDHVKQAHLNQMESDLRALIGSSNV